MLGMGGSTARVLFFKQTAGPSNRIVVARDYFFIMLLVIPEKYQGSVNVEWGSAELRSLWRRAFQAAAHPPLP